MIACFNCLPRNYLLKCLVFFAHFCCQWVAIEYLLKHTVWGLVQLMNQSIQLQCYQCTLSFNFTVKKLFIMAFGSLCNCLYSAEELILNQSQLSCFQFFLALVGLPNLCPTYDEEIYIDVANILNLTYHSVKTIQSTPDKFS